MYSFLRKPRWLAFLFLGVVGAIGMPLLGQWQINRYHDKQTENKVVKDRLSLSPVPLRVAVSDTATIADGASKEWQRVSMTGTFDAGRQVLIDLRSYKGHPGYHVVTPLQMDDGRAVLINRGWVPQESAVDGPRPSPTPPSGQVTLVGRIRASQIRSIGPKDNPLGTLTVLARVDVERIGQQTPYRLAPVYVELINQDPMPSDELALIEARIPDAGTNLSYAMQWFFFTAVGLITWPIIIRREAARRSKKKSTG